MIYHIDHFWFTVSPDSKDTELEVATKSLLYQQLKIPG